MPTSEVHAVAKAVAGLATRSTDMQKEGAQSRVIQSSIKASGNEVTTYCVLGSPHHLQPARLAWKSANHFRITSLALRPYLPALIVQAAEEKISWYAATNAYIGSE